MDVFIARRPVLDRFSKVYGYKLVHSSMSEPHAIENSEDSALQLIDNSMLVFNLESLASGKRVFFTFTHEALANECAELLPRESAVIDLHPSVRPDEEHVSACMQLYDAGYTIAAPYLYARGDDNGLLDLADIISVDFRHWPNHQVMTDQIGPLGKSKTILARSVDSMDEYKLALDLGCTYVEGQFFSKPIIVAGQDIPGFKPNYLKLLQELSEDELNFKHLNEIISREVSLAYKLLRLVNSPLFGLRVKVNAIDRALMMLGERGIRQWASVIAVSELSSSAPPELIITSAVRARFCQLIGEHLGEKELAQDLFLMGLFSLLDAISSRPLDQVIEELGIDGDVKDALNGEPNALRPIYELVLAYEQGSWDEVTALASQVGIERSDVPGLYLPAVEWANSSLAMTT